MSLYDLKQEDIEDLRALISAASLTITANNAARVTQLQALLRNAVPSRALEESEARRETLEHEVQECLRKRDAALLDAGLAKAREAKYIDAQASLEACARGDCDPSTCDSLRHHITPL